MEACKKAFETWLEVESPTEEERSFVDSLKFGRDNSLLAFGYFAGYHAKNEIIRELYKKLEPDQLWDIVSPLIDDKDIATKVVIALHKALHV